MVLFVVLASVVRGIRKTSGLGSLKVLVVKVGNVRLSSLPSPPTRTNPRSTGPVYDLGPGPPGGSGAGVFPLTRK